GTQAYCAIAALDVPAASTAAIAKILNLVGIAASAKHQQKRQSAATEMSTAYNGIAFRWAESPATSDSDAVLAAAGYNFGLLLRWLERLLRALMRMLLAIPAPAQNA